MKIVEEDLSLCHSLAAAMQEHCLELVQYIDTGALVLPAKHQIRLEPLEGCVTSCCWVRLLQSPLSSQSHSSYVLRFMCLWNMFFGSRLWT